MISIDLKGKKRKKNNCLWVPICRPYCPHSVGGGSPTPLSRFSPIQVNICSLHTSWCLHYLASSRINDPGSWIIIDQHLESSLIEKALKSEKISLSDFVKIWKVLCQSNKQVTLWPIWGTMILDHVGCLYLQSMGDICRRNDVVFLALFLAYLQSTPVSPQAYNS